MEDIEVIRELEKLLGVKAQEIAQKNWKQFNPDWEEINNPINEIYYLVTDRKVDKLAINTPNLKNSLEGLFEILGNLNSLTELDLSNNKIKKLPDSISQLTSLLCLNLSQNQFEEFPEIITKLTSLIILKITFNWLQKIPKTISKLRFLKQFDLALNPLKEFPESVNMLNTLTILNLSSTELTEIPESITELKFLKVLGLSNNQFKNFPDSISKLTALTDLYLADNQLNEISASISDLTSLAYLNLSGNQLIEIPISITNLINLVKLDLTNNELREIPVHITKLTFLSELNMANNELKEIPKCITELSSLTYLDLSDNPLKNFPKPISELTSLKSLFLSGNQLKEIPESIISLKSLENLDLSWNELTAIPESIVKLTSLVGLNLKQNQIKSNILQIKQIVNLPKLKKFILSDNPVPIAAEILGFYYNCLPDLRNYFHDGDNHGWSENNELKIILIGNGGTGKTSLANRLVKNSFIEDYKSTHGIQLSQYNDLNPYIINIWDFAGQDIYHATHRMFMRARALFLILWDHETESQEYTIVKESNNERNYKNYKLDYWLNYAKVLGKGSRALVIQSKEARDGKKNPPQELIDAYKDIWIDNLCVDSAHDDPDLNGFENLKTAIRKTIKTTDLLGKEQLPNNWVVSRDEFYRLLNKGIKTISYKDFATMCKGKESVNPDTILHWLVDSGVVFYREGLFNNQIIIDQQWAINAVYTLFDRDNVYYDFLQNKKGFFTQSDLGKIWKDNNEEERKLFLSYMKSCEICYEKDNGYIAPALLPEDRPAILNGFWEGKESHFVKYQMLFFHYGTMQSFLVRLGNMQLDALEVEELWQYGISFRYKENTFALVEAKPDEKQIIIRVSGQEAKSLLDKIRNLIEKIQDKEEIVESFSKDGNAFFSEKDKEKYSEMRKFFEKNEEDKFDKERRNDLQEIKETLQGIKQKQNEDKNISKEILTIVQDTFSGVDLLLDEVGSFKIEFSKFKQEFSSRKEDDETRINQLNELIDNHRLLLEKDKNQRLTDAKEKAQNAFSKFASLQTDSKEFLAMGFYFLEILPDNGDFSPAALQFCRALELEMKVVFINFKNSPFKTLIGTYETGNNKRHKDFLGFMNNTNNKLMLGAMVNAISVLASPTSTLHQFTIFVDLKNFMISWKSDTILNQFSIEVEIFGRAGDSPRNKSAHTHPLSKTEALDCKERVLRALDCWLL